MIKFVCYLSITLLFIGCSSDSKDYDELLIINGAYFGDPNTACKKYIPNETNSVIEIKDTEKTCEDYDRKEGDHCQVRYESEGDITCVIGYE